MVWTIGVLLLILSVFLFAGSLACAVIGFRRRAVMPARVAAPVAVAPVAPPPSPPMKATIAVPASQLPSPYGTLTCTHGARKGDAFVLKREGLTIGRDAPAEIVLADPSVSKKHVWIGPRGEEVVAIDHGSTNGTWINSLNGERITEATLRSGDVIIVGTNDFARFEYRSGV
jgi:pSer/pThr/pTyr-binding forkhead associated (FHA) protein